MTKEQLKIDTHICLDLIIEAIDDKALSAGAFQVVLKHEMEDIFCLITSFIRDKGFQD